MNIEHFDSFSLLPQIGNSEIIYQTMDDKQFYRWDGNYYPVVPIPGELIAVDMGGKVTNSDLIFDKNKNKFQSEINEDIQDSIDDTYTKEQINLLLSTKTNDSELADVAKSGSYNDLSNKPTKLSQFTNDVGYLTQHLDISGKADKSNTYTKTEVNGLISQQEAKFSDYYTKTQIDNQLLQLNNTILGIEEDLITSVEYTSGNIVFKHNNTVLFTLSAAPFIKDGMVSNVEISNGNLVISFNTDSGKLPISIPLDNIFNPDNYYTKTEINTLVNAKYTKPSSGIPKTDLAQSVQLSLDKADALDNLTVPTDSEITELINEIEI